MAHQSEGPPVFVVHGHDHGSKETVARFLEHEGYRPVVLHEQASRSQTIIEKFERHAAGVRFAVVLLTPDDVGCPNGEEADGLRPRARQNVLLELGYFCGSLGRHRVCALHKGDVEIPSDWLGVMFVQMDDQGAWRAELKRELEVAFSDEGVVDAKIQGAALRAEARRLLIEATAGETFSQFYGRIQTGLVPGRVPTFTVKAGKTILERTEDPRTRAMWEGALQDLREVGFIERTAADLDSLTREGHEHADQLRKSESSGAADASRVETFQEKLARKVTEFDRRERQKRFLNSREGVDWANEQSKGLLSVVHQLLQKMPSSISPQLIHRNG